MVTGRRLCDFAEGDTRVFRNVREHLRATSRLQFQFDANHSVDEFRPGGQILWHSSQDGIQIAQERLDKHECFLGAVRVSVPALADHPLQLGMSLLKRFRVKWSRPAPSAGASYQSDDRDDRQCDAEQGASSGMRRPGTSAIDGGGPYLSCAEGYFAHHLPDKFPRRNDEGRQQLRDGKSLSLLAATPLPRRAPFV